MKLFAKFSQRNNEPMLIWPQVNFDITSYSWSYRGGPDECHISAWGNKDEMWKLAEWLRCPVEIVDENGDFVWWGYIDNVGIKAGPISAGVTIDTMNNKVATKFTTPGADSGCITSWATNTQSINAFGTKEMLLSLGTGGSAQADALRDRQLEERKFPTPVIEHGPGTNSYSVDLNCKGWWHTLTWKYFSQPAGEEQYSYEGLGTQYIGDSASEMRIRQGFMLDDNVDSWVAYTLQLKMRKANNPATEFKVMISGSTGTQLTTASLAASVFGPNHAWHEFTLSPSITIAGSTLYYITACGNATACGTDYYVVNVNQELSYTRGSACVYSSSTSAWYGPDPSYDMEFRVLGKDETSHQALICASRTGQFFSGVTLDCSSSIWSSPYQNGDRLGRDVLEELLEGGTSNKRRMLASVTRDRNLIIKEEPDYASSSLVLHPDGQIRDLFGNLITHKCPVGEWIKLQDIFPLSLDTTLFTGLNTIFVERATFNVQDHTLRLEPRAGAEKFAVVKAG